MGRILRWGSRVLPLLLLLLLVAGSMIPPVLVRTTLGRASWLEVAIAWVAGWPLSAVQVGAVAVHPDGTFHVEHLHILPPDAGTPEVEVRMLTASVPDPSALFLEGRVDLGEVTVSGLSVTARTQGPPRPLRSDPNPGWSISASSVVLVDGAFYAPEDRHHPEVVVEGVDATADNLVWQVSRRAWHGRLSGDIARFSAGAVEVTDLAVPMAVLDGYRLEIGATSFRYGDTPGVLYGEVRGLGGRAQTHIELVVAEERLEDLVRTSLGASSPMRGLVSTHLTLEAGGALPPGGARFTGRVNIADAEIREPEELSKAQSALISLAPWVKRGAPGWIAVGDLIGWATFGRGWVQVHSLERVQPHQHTLQAWGSLRGRKADLRVRMVPRRSDRYGFGVAVRGPLDQPDVKIVHGEELRLAPPLISRPAIR